MSPDTRDPEVMFWLTVSSYPACCIFHLLAPLPAHPSNHLPNHHLHSDLGGNGCPQATSSIIDRRRTATPMSWGRNLKITSVHTSWGCNLFFPFYWKLPFCSYVLTLESPFSSLLKVTILFIRWSFQFCILLWQGEWSVSICHVSTLYLFKT